MPQAPRLYAAGYFAEGGRRPSATWQRYQPGAASKPPVGRGEVARALHISAKAVEAHVSALLRRLQLSNRHELSRWAVERRLVD